MEPNEMEKTSSSKVILSIIVLLVVVAIAFAMLRNNKGDDNMMGSSTNATTTLNENGGAFSGTILDLAQRGGDYKCTWSSEQSGAKLEGTVYVSRGKFKSDVEVSGAGMNTIAHAIGDGEYVYSWSSLVPQGVKFPMSKDNAGATTVSGSGAQNAQFSGNYNYNCESWRAESGAFALPSGITFTEAATATGTQQ